MVKTLCVVTCPNCSQEHREQMPMYSVVKEFKCRRCGNPMEVGADECCIFCVYGSRRCLSAQRDWRDNANRPGTQRE